MNSEFPTPFSLLLNALQVIIIIKTIKRRGVKV
jgi:hypothetical protein